MSRVHLSIVVRKVRKLTHCLPKPARAVDKETESLMAHCERDVKWSLFLSLHSAEIRPALKTVKLARSEGNTLSVEAVRVQVG